MDTFSAMFNTVLLFTVLLVPGYVLAKTKLIEDGAAFSFSNILMYVAMPFLVFVKILEIDFKQVGWIGIAVSAIFPIVLSFLLVVIAKWLCKGETAQRRACIFCATFPNCGFVGIPLAATMWPDRPQIILYVSIFNVVSTFLLLTLGVYVLSGNKDSICMKKTLVSPIFLVILLGVPISLLRWVEYIPAVVSYSTILAQIATPLAMIALGYELSKIKPFKKMWTNINGYTVSLIKLIISPLITCLLFAFLKFVLRLNIDEALIFAMMTATAVSTAASAPAMAKKYECDAEYAASLTLINTLLCVLTLPLMYTLFSLF